MLVVVVVPVHPEERPYAQIGSFSQSTLSCSVAHLPHESRVGEESDVSARPSDGQPSRHSRQSVVPKSVRALPTRWGIFHE